MRHLSTVLILLLWITGQSVFSQKSNEIVDTRIDNMAYWKQKAQDGLVPIAPVIPFKPAVYKTSAINAASVVTENSPDVPVTSATDVTESENSVFVDPNNADYVLNSNNSTSWSGGTVGSLYGSNYFQSADAGLNWGGSASGAGGANSGDPAAAISLSGRQYVNYISDPGGQGVAYSDNGTSWTPVIIAPNPGSLADKNHMWIDNSASSSYQGNLYTAWTPFGGTDDAEIVISRSSTNGTSWTSPLNISAAISAGSHNQGVNVKTGPNGEVYAVWAVYDSWPSDEGALGFSKSSDGGTTYSSGTRILSNIRGIRTTGTSKSHRVNSFPSMAVDISGGIYNGNIYIVWANVGVPGVNTGTNISVYLIRSEDGGTTWSTPVRVNQNTYEEGKEAYFPWIACDPSSGVISIISYDDRNTSSASCEVFVANSFDGGLTFEDFVVSDVAFTPAPIPGLASDYMGDYLGITAQDGKVYPCWTDNRGGIYMTYVSPFETNNLEKPIDLVATLNEISGQVDLGWDFVSTPGFVNFNIYRDGSLIGSTTSKSYIDNLPTYGLYTYSVTAVHLTGESIAANTSVQWGNAAISVNPVSVTTTLPPDASTVEFITVSNTGELDLDYTVSTLITSKSPLAYCAASGGCDEYISRVAFNTIDNVTGCSGYADYTTISTTVFVGDTYNLIIENGTVYTSDDLGVWIDWNQDDDFDDVGENVVCDIDNSGQGTFAITIPADALSGSTVMRIRMKYSGSDCGSPCGATTYGEVEDYALNVIGWLSVNPLSGTIVPGSNQQLDVSFNSTGLAEGVYTADITINSNDPSQPSLVVPATLNVSLGNPVILVSTTSMVYGDLQVGLNLTQQFTISNTGTGVLAGNITTPEGYSIGTAANVLGIAIGEGEAETFDLTFAPTLVQAYNGNVVIDHNAPGNQNLIAVSGTGTPGPQPSILVNPDQLNVSLAPDDNTDETLLLSNPGDASLNYTSSVSYPAKTSWYNPFFKIGYTAKNFSESQSYESAPFKQVGISAPKAQGDILQQIDVETPTGDNNILGGEFDGTDLWFTGGGSGGTNMLYRLDVAGNLLNSYTQNTTSDWGMRDMAFDGTYLYAGDENGFYQINPATGAVTTLFTGNLTLGTIRALAFNPVNGHFYASNWSTSIIEFDASGTQYSSLTNPGLSTIYGLAYDNQSGNLWIFDRTGSPQTTVYEYNISTQSLTGASIQVPLLSGLTDQMNGGLFYSDDLIGGKGVLGGVVQGTDLDTFFAMELYEQYVNNWLSISNNGSGSIVGGGSTNVTVHFDASGLAIGTYLGNVEISSNDPNNPLVVVPCTLEVTDASTIVSVSAMLEGPFFNGLMTPWLNLFAVLPLNQPYNQSPWNYNGSESVAAIPSSQVVDWILVELRETSGDASTASSDKIIGRKAGFILNDGSVVNFSGSGPLTFGVVVSENLYAVLWHRNHLGIMSAQPLSYTGGQFVYDFTASENAVYGGIHAHKELSPGIWGMASGDGNNDGEINNPDKDDIWVSERGNSGYYKGDYNMNNNVYDEDNDLFWQPNSGKGTKVIDGGAINFSSQIPE